MTVCTLFRLVTRFADPASAGLDSTNAAAVVGILAALGGRGVTIVLSIHQPRPDVLRLMDRALILSGFGEVVYSGDRRCPMSQLPGSGHGNHTGSGDLHTGLLCAHLVW